MFKHIYISRNNLWPIGRAVVRSHYAMGGGPGVEPRGLPYILHTTTSQPMSDTWRPRIGPCVLISFASQRTRVSSRFANNQPINICHVTTVRSYGPATSDRTDCTDWYSQHQIFCLFGLTNKSRYLLHTESV